MTTGERGKHISENKRLRGEENVRNKGKSKRYVGLKEGGWSATIGT